MVLKADTVADPASHQQRTDYMRTDCAESPQYAPLFVVSWESSAQDGSFSGIYAQRYDASGTAVGGEFRVNTTTASDQLSSSITALSDGGFVVSWESSAQDGSFSGIYAQRYDANGDPVQNGIKLTAINDAPGFTKGADETAGENTGAQTVTGWATGISAGPADESSQTLTFLTSNGNEALFAAQPAIDASGNLTYTPAANAHGSVEVTVSLQDDGGTANGGVDTSAPQTFTITINNAPVLNGALTSQAIKFDSNMNYDAGASFSDPNDDALSFSATLANGDPLPAWLQVSPDGVISGLPAAGDSGSYALAITATDTYGAAVSAPVNVTVTAFDAGQLLISTSGNDTLTGTAGIDTATYAFSPSAVTVSLANRAAQNTGHGIDTLSGIENLIGSAANDTLTGDRLANVLDGGLGADRLIGGAGNDTYVIDDIADVIIELGDNLESQASNGKADQVLTWITLPGLANYVENLTLLGSANVNANGNALANTLTSNAGDNVLDGKSGKDAMFGGGGLAMILMWWIATAIR
ncbi:MAG: putative Ig domain-containing protein [Proteobacteria bacterium]|nr:putative Ig domain-containing protein [Pseudomonadota bacterium]